MDQALKSLIASEEEVVTSLGLSRQWHLFLTSAQHLRLQSLSCSRDWGWGRKLSLLSLSPLGSSLFSSTLPPLCHPSTPHPCLTSLCLHAPSCHTPLQ